MTQKRWHPPAEVANHPAIQMAFQTLGAILISSKGRDLECDFMMADAKTGKMKQFHIEVSIVDESNPT